MADKGNGILDQMVKQQYELDSLKMRLAMQMEAASLPKYRKIYQPTIVRNNVTIRMFSDDSWGIFVKN